MTTEQIAKMKAGRQAKRLKNADSYDSAWANPQGLTKNQLWTLKGTGKTQNPENPLFSLMLRCYEGKATPGQRMKAKCLECCAFQRNEITLCGVTSCPLWLKRPYQAEKQ